MPARPASPLRRSHAILAAGFDVPLVLTQPDRPKGRGLVAEPSPVKRLAGERRLAVLQPATLKTDEARAPLLAVPLDVLVVAAYGLILPPAVLSWPRYGCLNIHASALPRWRGAAPIQRAIAAGDTATGVTIMQMDAGLDTGAMVELVPVPIDPRETAATLHDKLAAAGAAAVVDVLRRLARDGVAERDAAARDGRHLCRQGRARRRSHRLVRLRRRDRPAGPRLRSGARSDHSLRRVWPSRSGARNPLPALMARRRAQYSP